MEEDEEPLITYFMNKEDMKEFCSKIAGGKCIKCKIRNNGNYYKIFCKETNCSFQITYSPRDSPKYQRGFYLISQSTCLHHQANCPNIISNIQDTKNPKFIAIQILPLFKERFPSLCEIKSAIQCFNGNDFSKSELKYIKKLAKLDFFHDATTTISQLVDSCQNLRNTHNWQFQIEFVDGMIASLILFPPWWNTQAIGLIIRGTEDTQGYAHLFNYVSKVIGDEHITIIVDMAKCIQKAAKESFNHYSFVFCYFHLKQNYLKNIKFTPSEDLWYSLQLFMKGEISYEAFQNNWIKEESYVDIETKGFTYLCKYVHYFTPKPMTHNRGIISSQRIENLNGLMKKHGNSALEMLSQFVAISTRWFEKGSTVTYPHDRFLTYYADDILNKVIQSEFKTTKFDEILHFPLNETECACGLCRDLGIPCPFTIRLLRIKQSHSGNDGTDPMNSSLFNNESLLKLISPEWLVSTHQKAFEPLIERKNDTFHVLPLDEIKDGFNSQHLDIISAKIRWLYQNSPKYKANVDDLLSKAQEEIVFPFFNIKKPKNSEKKRHLSYIEINQKKKTNDEKRDILLKHLDGNKITKASLLALADHLTCTNNDLPKVNKSISKEKLLEWFDANWKIISPMLGVLKNTDQDTYEINENEDDSFFLDNEDDF
ncbi:hypothetical protein M9Y10_002393 [Tritrichomonas musculus]|uniref:MULE transposase domain-containing protein n=1 Tax=Tritrichomonas musculus TaxID=1915356 RepID=A0ABR2L9N7_9EUKA